MRQSTVELEAVSFDTPAATARAHSRCLLSEMRTESAVDLQDTAKSLGKTRKTRCLCYASVR